MLIKSGISKYLLLCLCWLASMPIVAQQDSARYDRPSLCMMMVGRQEMSFSNEIEEVFEHMDMPERYNDHSLGVRVFRVTQDGRPMKDIVTAFAEHAQVAKRMVAKWFGRNKESGCFNMDMLQARGLYNATRQDWIVALQTMRGSDLLADAGEKLIKKTFLVVNEFRYEKKYSTLRDKSDSQELTLSELDLSDREAVDAYNEHVHGGDLLLSEFTISCTSYLFQLDWNEEVAATFYYSYFFPCSDIDADKAQAFKQDKELFHMTYVGMCSDKLTERNTDNMTTSKLVKKACVRITDQNIATLQHTYPDFRIKAMLVGTEPIKAYVGLKEDITPSSRYEVLEPTLRSDGTYSYKRVGVIKPIAGKIWDNRYMASKNDKSDLDATYFEQVSGGALYPGLIIREIANER